MRWVALGANGYFPSFDRETMSFLVLPKGGPAAEGAILLDAGTGVGRLLSPALHRLLDDRTRLDIILTHYHLDHVVGLSYLPAVWPDRPITLWAPEPPLVDGTPDEAFRGLLSPPLFVSPLESFPMPLEVRPYSGDFEVGGIEVRTRRQEHPGGSVGIRLGNRLAYCTDTVVDDETVDFIRGVGTLIHEVWTRGADGDVEAARASGHSDPDGVGKIARKAPVRELFPVHHHPSWEAEQLTEMLSALRCAAPGVEVELPSEGRVRVVAEPPTPLPL